MSTMRPPYECRSLLKWHSVFQLAVMVGRVSKVEDAHIDKYLGPSSASLGQELSGARIAIFTCIWFPLRAKA